MSEKLTPEQQVKLSELLAYDKKVAGKKLTDARMEELIKQVRN